MLKMYCVSMQNQVFVKTDDCRCLAVKVRKERKETVSTFFT
jgi:hypothetical protein